MHIPYLSDLIDSPYQKLQQTDNELPMHQQEVELEEIHTSTASASVTHHAAAGLATSHRLQAGLQQQRLAADAQQAARTARADPAGDLERQGKSRVTNYREVIPGQFSLKHAAKNLGKAAKTGVYGAASIGIGYAAATRMANAATNTEDGESLSMGGGMLAAGMLPLVSLASNKFINAASDAIFVDGFMDTAQAMEANWHQQRIDFPAIYLNSADGTTHWSEDIDKNLDILFASARRGDEPNIERMNRLMKWRNMLSNIPNQPKEVEAWKTPAGRKALLADIDLALEKTPPEHREDIKSILIQIAANSVKLEGDDPDRRRLQISLKGPPGTGKDHLVYHLIEKLLGIPVVELAVPPKEKGGVRALMGGEWLAIEQPDYKTIDVDAFGPLCLAWLAKGCSNAVLYLSEVDLREETVVNGLKRLLDPAKTAIPIKALKSELPFRDATVILARNDDNDDDALDDRMDENLAFMGTLRDAKIAGIGGYYKVSASKYSRSIVGGTPVLSKAELVALRDSFEQAMPLLLDLHEQKIPGSRMQFAGDVVTYIGGGLVEGKPKTAEQIALYIERHYAAIAARLPAATDATVSAPAIKLATAPVTAPTLPQSQTVVPAATAQAGSANANANTLRSPAGLQAQQDAYAAYSTGTLASQPPLQIANYRAILPGQFSLKHAAMKLGKATKTGMYQAASIGLGYEVATAMVTAASLVAKDGGMSAGGSMLAAGLMPLVSVASNKLINSASDAIFEQGFMTTAQAMEANWKQQCQDHPAIYLNNRDGKTHWSEDIDRNLGILFASAERGEEANTGRIGRLMRWRTMLFNLPSQPREVEAWKTKAGRDALLAKIDQALEKTPPQYREDIKSVLIDIAANSVRLEGDDPDRRRLQISLKGPPGTGKDFLVYQLIEQLLGIPVVEVVIPEKEQGGVESLLSPEGLAFDKEDLVTRDEDAFGQLAVALMKAGCTNPVLYLNEVDLREPTVVNGLKRLLDPAKTSIPAPAVKAAIPFRDTTVILSRNDDNDDDALDDRMNKNLSFMMTTREAKMDRAEFFSNLSSNKYIRNLDGGAPVLNHAQQQTLWQTYQHALPQMLDLHEQKIPGTRMQFAGNVVNYIAIGLVEGKPKTTRQVAQFIERHYQKMNARLAPQPAPASAA